MKKVELEFDEKKYQILEAEEKGQKLQYRAFENICYVECPENMQVQRLSIFVPECYYEGKMIGSYGLRTAPVFMPNTVGGYRTGLPERPERNGRGEINASFYALLHGYVVVSPGVRGWDLIGEDGSFSGIAPAAICDLKAAVRFLRKFSLQIPGDKEKIISNGTSAGGALSALLGSSGDHPDYEDILHKMGAADTSDHIFASSCYCPITNLEYADMAYEWEFSGLDEYYKGQHPINNSKKNVGKDYLTEKERVLSGELGSQFPVYVNSLDLIDDFGNKLMLDDKGNGSFKEYVLSFVKQSCQCAYERGEDLSQMDWLTFRNSQIETVDFRKYTAYRTRMKSVPAFDSITMDSPENKLFGTKRNRAMHFTEFSLKNSEAEGSIAEKIRIKMMNPMNYIEDEQACKAKHFRIRHGCIDRDTSLAISALLTAKLKNQGIDTELSYPWKMIHAGDYDLPELFAWIDQISNN